MISINDISYLDWKKGFKKKKSKDKSKSKKENDKMTNIGIPESEFKDFIKKWKKRNLRLKKK